MEYFEKLNTFVLDIIGLMSVVKPLKSQLDWWRELAPVQYGLSWPKVRSGRHNKQL